ncbi:7TM diverse intracellular signaling domain-containing protein [Psychrosphaera aestuarii]|uniref:7TM diverse intracellular signaling domain-containing protein n=1 Tax=Psychrosphaera aestuarii TaxID=1266052 RepID=UPI001B329DC9|nr:7TM diverse intracellular signaling domain-containing protein [Psychrosphaera aestuarii]
MRNIYQYGLIAIVLVFVMSLVYSSVSTFYALDGLRISDSELTTHIDKSWATSEIDTDQTFYIKNLNYQRFSKTINWGFDDRVFYYRYVISNLSSLDQRYTVYFDNPTIDSIYVYKQDRDTVRYVSRFGDGYEEQSRLNNRNTSSELLVPANSQKTIYFKTQTTGSAFLPLLVFKTEDFSRYKTAIYMVWGAFIGSAIVMTLYNIILYAGTRENIYLYYIGYVCVFLLQLGTLHGFNVYLVHDSIYYLLSNNINVLNCILCFFTLSLALHFLKLNKSGYSVVRFTHAFKYLLLLASVIFLFLKESTAAIPFFFLQAFTYALVIALLAMSFREHIHWTKFYIISWFPLFLGAAIGSLMFAGQLDYSFWNRHALLLGVLTEMSLISMALVQRLRATEQVRLYETTHDQLLGIANRSLFQKRVDELRLDKTVFDFSVLTFSVHRYSSIKTYLQGSLLKSATLIFLKNIEELLSLDLMIIEIDPSSEAKSAANIKEGVFAFLVISNDVVLLDAVLKKLADQQPVTVKLDELDIEVNFNFNIVVTSYQNSSYKTIDLIDDTLKAIDIAHAKNLSICILDKSLRKDIAKVKSQTLYVQDTASVSKIEYLFQPQIDIKKKKCIGAEIMPFICNKQTGQSEPVRTSDFTNSLSLSTTIIENLLEQACVHLKSVRRHTNGSVYTLTIKLCLNELDLDRFVKVIKRKISTHEVDANQFVLELTCNDTDVNDAFLLPNIKQLETHGFLLSTNFSTVSTMISYKLFPMMYIRFGPGSIMETKEGEINHNRILAVTAFIKTLANKVLLELSIEDFYSIDFIDNENLVVQSCALAQPMQQEQYLLFLDKYNRKESE